MKDTSTENLFKRFRDDHDLAALAQVYDRLAPHLLALARRLGGPGEAGEDLLQETFLVAIQNSKAWEEGRPLGPWLLGILTHRAQAGRRRSSRTIDEGRLPIGPIADPGELAHAAEFQRDVQAAIRTLPPLLRGTVESVLQVGEKPSQIAVELGIKPGTVRQRLKRGLTQVRMHLRQAGWMWFAWLGFRSSAFLDVRKSLLEAAANQTPSGAMPQLVSTGTSAVGRVVQTGLAVALGTGLVWAVWPQADLPVSALQKEAMQTPLAQTALPGGAHTHQVSPEPQDNRQVQAPAPKLTLDIRDLLGRPVPELQLGSIDHTHWSSLDFETRTPIESLGTTDDQGHFASLPFEHDCSIVSLNPNWLIVEESTVLENTSGKHRLLARQGGSIFGVIVGDQGPIAGALVSALVSNEFLTLGKAARDEAKRTGPKPALFDPANPRQTFTDANGLFELGGLLPSSTQLAAISDGYVPSQFEFQGAASHDFTDIGSFTLKRGIAVTVLVQTEAHAAPSGKLSLERSDDAFCRGMQGVPIDLHGEVHLADMATGEYKWTIERDDTLAVWGKFTVAKAGEIISISLPRTASKRVIVQDASGLSIPRLTVKASELGKLYRELQGDGHVQFQCGLDSTVKFRVHAIGYASSAALQIPADQNEFVVRLQKLGGLQLSGLTGSQVILAAALPDRQKDKLLLLNISLSPVSLKLHPVHAGQLMLTDLEPGPNWVIVDVGGGPMALGPFDINEDRITRAQASLPQTRSLEIHVRDSDTGLALPSVSLQLVSNDLIPKGKISYLMDFMGPSDHELATGINGSATLQLRTAPNLYLRLSKEGFETKFIPGSELQATGPSLLLDLQPLPSSEVWVDFQAGQPASDAHVYFSKGPENTSSPAGSLRTDAAGKGLCEAIVPGRLNASIRYELTESVTYHVHWPGVEAQPEQTTYICLLPKSAQISLSKDMLRGAKSFSLRRTPDRISSKFQVTWKQQADDAPPQQVQVIPGEYQIEVLGSGPPRYGRVQVASGESIPVTSETKLYGLTIETTGEECETATFHLRNMAGPYRNVSRSVHQEAPGPLLVQSLPAGLYRVSLTGWTHGNSNKQQSTQSQFVVIKDKPTHLTFHLPPPTKNAD